MANIILGAVKTFNKSANFYQKTVVVVLTVGVLGGGGYLGYRQLTKKPAPKPATTQSQTNTASQNQITESADQKVVYDGTYVGTAGAAQGLTGATLVVVGQNISGPGTYKSVIYGQANTVTVNVSGSVSAAGAIKGTFSGNGSVMGRSVPVSGTVAGSVKNGTMALGWSSIVFGEKVTGKITLKKR